MLENTQNRETPLKNRGKGEKERKKNKGGE